MFIEKVKIMAVCAASAGAMVVASPAFAAVFSYDINFHPMQGTQKFSVNTDTGVATITGPGNANITMTNAAFKNFTGGNPPPNFAVNLGGSMQGSFTDVNGVTVTVKRVTENNPNNHDQKFMITNGEIGIWAEWYDSGNYVRYKDLVNGTVKSYTAPPPSSTTSTSSSTSTSSTSSSTSSTSSSTSSTSGNVPAPAIFGLFGLAGLGLMARRRKKITV